MARKAQEQQVRRLVVAAVLAMDDVVNLEAAARTAARYTAAPTVPPPDQAPDAGRHVLVCARWRVAIDGADVLRVARRLLDHVRVDGDRYAGALLRARLAHRTYGQRDLVLGSASGLARRCPIDHRPAQPCDQPIVIEVFVALLAHELVCLA
jgi:hypothetical protein